MTLAVAPEGDVHPIAHPVLVQALAQLPGGGDRLAVDRLDDVAGDHLAARPHTRGADAGLLRRRAGRHLQHHHPGHLELAGDGAADVLVRDHAEPRPHIAPARDQLRHHPVDGVHRHREADTRIGAGGAVDGGVDADQAAGRVEQGAARVAGVDRGIGLDQVADQIAVLLPQGAVQGRDQAAGEGVVQAEGVADGEGLLPHLEIVAGADGHRRRTVDAHVDTQHRQIVLGTGAHQHRAVAAAVVEAHQRLRGALDHMVVGHYMPQVVPDEARAGAFGHAEDVARPDVHHPLPGGDIDHRGAGAFEDLDGGLLVRGQVATRRDRSRLCGQPHQVMLDQRQELPQHEQQHQGPEDQAQAGEIGIGLGLWLHDGIRNSDNGASS